MKLALISYGYDQKSFSFVKERGLDAMELCVNVNADVHDFCNSVDEIKRNGKETGVQIISVGRWGSERLSKEGTINQEELANEKSLIEAAHKIGSPVYITGCNYLENLSLYENCNLAIDYLSRLLEFGKKYNVKIATYNCRWNNFICTDSIWQIVHGYLKDLGIKYDPSHAIYDNADYLQEASKWGDRFYHVHIKGSLKINGSRFDDPPAGMDATNWGAFISILYAKGYNGYLSIEPHSGNWYGDSLAQGIDFTVNYIKRYIF